jgi:transposase-like protein
MLGSIFLNTGNKAEKRTVCPSCNLRAIRSRRTGFERFFFFIRAYRCESCKSRFRKVRFTG